jgi:hypothetical protein
VQIEVFFEICVGARAKDDGLFQIKYVVDARLNNAVQFEDVAAWR